MKFKLYNALIECNRLNKEFREKLQKKEIKNQKLLLYNDDYMSSLYEYLEKIREQINNLWKDPTNTFSLIEKNFNSNNILEINIKDILSYLQLQNNPIDKENIIFLKDNFNNYVFINLSNIYFEESFKLTQPALPSTSFSNSIFAQDVILANAFYGNVYLTNIIASQNFSFSYSLKLFDLSNSKINSGVFDGTAFYGATIFDNVKFNHLPHFNNPQFTNKKDTSFSNLSYGKESEKDSLSVCLIYKNELNKLGDYVEENKVFAIEQKIRLNKDIDNFWISKNWTLVPNIFISTLYRLVSNYGQATLKPILLWFGLLFYCGFLFSFFHLVERNPSIQKYWGTRIFNDMELGYLYSFQNISNPLSVFSTDVPLYPYNTSAAVIAHLEAILSVIIITLWVFALKRRFQKGE